MTTKFMVIESYLGRGTKSVNHYYNSLKEALESKHLEGDGDIYEVDEKGKKLVSLLQYQPENNWKITVEK